MPLVTSHSRSRIGSGCASADRVQAIRRSMRSTLGLTVTARLGRIGSVIGIARPRAVTPAFAPALVPAPIVARAVARRGDEDGGGLAEHAPVLARPAQLGPLHGRARRLRGVELRRAGAPVL